MEEIYLLSEHLVGVGGGVGFHRISIANLLSSTAVLL